jgi:hypothetical protein
MNFHKTHTFFLISLMFLSCQNVKDVEKPDDLIGEEKMTDILYDLALIDAARSTSRAKDSTKNLDPKTYIFQKYNIDSAQLAASQAYYLQEFNVNLRMYEEVRERLQERKEILDSLLALDKDLKRKIKDSLKIDSLKPEAKAFKNLQKLGGKLPMLVPKKDTLD